MAPAVKSKEKQLFLGGSLLWVEFDIFLSQQNLISIKCPQPLSSTTAGAGAGAGEPDLRRRRGGESSAQQEKTQAQSHVSMGNPKLVTV